jgi:ribosomal protein S18 acetylase RimI-like enzyme
MSQKDDKIRIKEIDDSDGIKASAEVIRDSFRTVAQQFNLTQQNCHSHPSFVTESQLNAMKRRGLTLFGLSQNKVQVGFIAIERLDAAIYSIEKLAVLPSFRHHGYGQMLLKFAIDHVRNNGGQKVSIGIINEHMSLLHKPLLTDDYEW